jgi:hypothetical protein
MRTFSPIFNVLHKNTTIVVLRGRKTCRTFASGKYDNNKNISPISGNKPFRDISEPFRDLSKPFRDLPEPPRDLSERLATGSE